MQQFNSHQENFMTRVQKNTFNQEAVQLLGQLKSKWGLKTDKQLAERLNIRTTQIARWKTEGIKGLSATFIKEILGENEGEKGQHWLAAA